MRIAIGIITLVLMILFGVESFLAHTAASISGNVSTLKGANLGEVVAFLFLLAGSFIFESPLVSFIAFIVATLVCIYGAGFATYYQIGFYGIAAIILGILSFFEWRSYRKYKPISNSERAISI